MAKLTPTQQVALDKLSTNPQSAYDLGISLATLRALVKKGVARDVTPFGPGGMFSPATHYVFVRRPVPAPAKDP